MHITLLTSGRFSSIGLAPFCISLRMYLTVCISKCSLQSTLPSFSIFFNLIGRKRYYSVILVCVLSIMTEADNFFIWLELFTIILLVFIFLLVFFSFYFSVKCSYPLSIFTYFFFLIKFFNLNSVN